MKTNKEKIDAIIEILQESTANYNGLKSEIVRLYKHMIKCIYQPELHTDSWDKTINNAYTEITGFINKSHYNKLINDFDSLYRKALQEANKETNSRDNERRVDVFKEDAEVERSVKDIYPLSSILSEDFLKVFYSDERTKSQSPLFYSGRYRKV